MFIGGIIEGEIWCEDCIRDVFPEGIDSEGKEIKFFDVDFEHSDSPIHCGRCHKYLGGELTSDGVEYVLDSLENWLEGNEPGDPIVMDEWAKDLAERYLLSADEEVILTRYLKFRGCINLIYRKKI